jgi:hypothetical protein
VKTHRTVAGRQPDVAVRYHHTGRKTKIDHVKDGSQAGTVGRIEALMAA